MTTIVGCKKNVEVAVTGQNCKVIIDIAKEASSQALTYQIIEEKMNSYAEMGIKEICFIPIPDTYAVTESCQGSVLCDPSIQSDHMHRSVHATLDPNLAFILSCKKADMKATVLYKPYEMGGSVTIPYVGSQFSFGEMNTLGGTAVFCSADFAGNTTLLLSSRAFENGSATQGQSVATLELVFAAEAFENRTAQDTVSKLNPNANASITPVVWGSKTENINYQKLTDVSCSTKQETREFTDANGASLGEKACVVLTVDVSSYNRYKYFAVSFANGNELYTVPFSMINAYAADGSILLTTKTVYTRNPYSDELLNVDTVPTDYIWGAERKPILTTEEKSLSAFKAYGFEFQYGGIGADFGDGWHNAYVYGIAIGTQNYLRSNYCEYDEGVRNYWLDQIDRFYAKGADTVIISLENWGGTVYDYTNYGFNYRYTKEYKTLYGVDILTEDFDYLKLMEIRGKYFSEFLTAVGELADKNGKKWGVELFSSFENPTLDDDLNGLCHYNMPKLVFDWKAAVDACDVVLIKDYVWGDYQKELANGIRDYADAANKTVLLMGYEKCGISEDYVQKALQDERNDAIVLDSQALLTQLFQK